MKTYSQDLREKMLAAMDRGMPRKEAVSAFGVSSVTLKRWGTRTSLLGQSRGQEKIA
jgi:transposase